LIAAKFYTLQNYVVEVLIAENILYIIQLVVVKMPLEKQNKKLNKGGGIVRYEP